MKQSRFAIGAALAAAMLMAGCGTGGTSQPTTQPNSTSQAPTDEQITLKISFVSDPPITPLVEAFQDLNPNVDVEMVQTPFADYQTSLKLLMQSDEAPDIVQYSPGPMRAIVPAGLVMGLDDHASELGWRERVSPSLLSMLSSNPEATEYGSGTLYAMPGAVQMIGVFYNKALTADAGVDGEPATLSEFEADMAAVKAAGTTPLSMPSLGVAGFQMWGALSNVMGDVDLFNEWVQGIPGTDLTTEPGFVEAAATIKKWADADFFAEDVSSQADADGIAEFTAGSTAYYVTGNWNTRVFADALGEDLGFFLMPGVTADQAAVATGSAFPYSISANSANQETAVAFLDFISSGAAADASTAGGFVPVIPDVNTQPEGVERTVQAAYLDVVDGAGIAPFANWASASMLDVLTQGVQGVISGNMEPEAFVASLQADWESNRP